MRISLYINLLQLALIHFLSTRRTFQPKYIVYIY